MPNRTAIITGVSRAIGIGAAIARQFADANVDLCLCSYRPYDATMPWGSAADERDTLVAELQALGRRVAVFEADLSDPATPAALLDHATQALGHIDILVNNATYSVDYDLFALTAERLDQHYEVNVRGTLLLCREFAQRFRANDGGRIINLTSGQGVDAMPDNIAYAATKGAIESVTLSLAVALAPRGITVNAVDPGPTDTGWMSDALQDELVARSPHGRVGLPADAARLIAFLASPAAAWITGQVIRSRGGL